MAIRIDGATWPASPEELSKVDADALRRKRLAKERQAAIMQRFCKAQAAFGGGSIELKKGALRIRKVEEAQVAALQSLKRYVEGGDWKERFCVLKGSQLFSEIAPL